MAHSLPTKSCNCILYIWPTMDSISTSLTLHSLYICMAMASGRREVGSRTHSLELPNNSIVVIVTGDFVSRTSLLYSMGGRVEVLLTTLFLLLLNSSLYCATLLLGARWLVEQFASPTFLHGVCIVHSVPS